MTVLDNTLFERALFGEPLGRAVFAPTVISDRDHFWRVGGWPIVVPVPPPMPAPDMQRQVARLRSWTGWSARRLADALGTSHTTVLGVEGGRRLIQSHSGQLRQRLSDAHDVVERIFLVAGRDPSTTAFALETAMPGRAAAIDELRSGDPARAYLAAIDVLRPRPPGLLVGERPRRGGATAALHD